MHGARRLVGKELEAAETAASAIFLRVVFSFLNSDIGPGCQLAERRREGEVFIGHYESHGVSAFATTEASVGLSPGTDVEGRSLFVVKGAVSFEVRTSSFQVESVGCNEVHDIGCTEDLLDDFIWDAWHRRSILARRGRLAIHLRRRECEEV